jgi:hypothetical protein
MPHLIHLWLGHPRLKEEHRCSILPELEHLEELRLNFGSAVTQLAFLAHAPSSLRSLGLCCRKAISRTEARQLERFPLLEHLEIAGVFGQPLNPLWIAHLTPESKDFNAVTWPNLKTFSCREASYLLRYFLGGRWVDSFGCRRSKDLQFFRLHRARLALFSSAPPRDASFAGHPSFLRSPLR